MRNIINSLKRNKIGALYVTSGLFKTFIQTLVGFIILRWISPESLGEWQSFTVFTGYISILTLGITSGLNRDLPFLLGKGNKEEAISKLKTAGAFITRLSLLLILLTLVISVSLFVLKIFSFHHSLMLFFAFTMGSLSIQTNLLGATYRSDGAFNKLTILHFIVVFFHILLLPMIYFFDLWGYVAYQVTLGILLFIGYWHFRPYKVNYTFEYRQFKDLVKIGFPMYFWGYVSTLTRTIPRLTLVLFGSPLLVGLFSPASSINAAVLNLPSYVNRFLFPKMSFKLGQSDNSKEVIDYSYRAAFILFLVMLIIAIIIFPLLPIVFEILFPKYKDAVLAAQITLFSGVFYSVNAILHTAINSLKGFSVFKVIVGLRIFYIVFSITVIYVLSKDLLFSVALGAVISEALNMINYIYFLNKWR